MQINMPREVPVVPVCGFAEGIFEPLADIFGRVVGAQTGGGAALAIYRDGRLVVDLVGGDYEPDSLQLLFSVTKAVSAIAVAVLHEDGLLDLDAPISHVWPEMRETSSVQITTRSVLGHRSGLAALDRELTFEELLRGVDEDAIAAQEPYWEPDTAHGYHAFTFGTLLGGVVRRALGRTMGEIVADRISAPLDLDLWVGAPESTLRRIRPIQYQAPRVTAARASFLASTRIPPSPTGHLQRSTDLYNDPRVAQVCWPSTSGVAGARDLARLLQATLTNVDGVRLLSESALGRMTRTRSIGPDRVLGIPTAFGSGVQLPFPQLPMLGPRSFGHEAAGGSAIVADEDLGISVAFTTDVFPPMVGASGGFLSLLPTIRHLLTSDEEPRKR